ncbi:MAG: metalloregulator ArsR/SmtB family transcription factor [Robiginitomaculum sp.]
MADNMVMEELEANAAKASALLKSMANESRLMILCQLSQGDMTVGQLQAVIPLSQSALSQHLATLRREGLVRTRRNAQFITYTLDSDEARTIIEALYGLFAGGDNCEIAPAIEASA